MSEELNLNRQNMGLPFDEPAEDKLTRMMRLQDELQRNTYGIDYSRMTDEERIHHFKEMLHAFNDEMHEALGEMGWKPWATSRHFNTPAVQAELIDAWHFFMNLMLISGLTPERLSELYEGKRAKNITRQWGNYDGITGKCKGCRRAFDDDEVKCHTSLTTRGDDVSCCHYNTPDGKLVL